MHITVDRRALTRALTAAQAVTDRVSPMPALGHVLLRADADGLTVSATDLALALRSTVAGEATKTGTGSLAAPAKSLLLLLAATKTETVTLRAAVGLRLVVTAGRSTYQLPCLDAREFPAISDAPEAWRGVSAGALRELLSLASHAICSDETRHHLCGVHLMVRDGAARAEATDGHRLAMIRSPLAAAPCDLILPQRGVAAALKLLGATDADECSIAVTPRDWWLRAEGARLSVLPVEGAFPPVDEILPKRCARRIVVARADLKAVLARIATLDGEVVLVATAGEPDMIILRARSADGGDGEEILDAQIGGSDQGVEIALHVSYVADALGVFSGERVAIECSDALDPIVLRAADDHDGDGDACVVMPRRW